jgi:5-methylcytosine-specific restriction endonuclease McrA
MPDLSQRSKPLENYLKKRSLRAYHNMKARANKVYVALPFTLEQFREWLRPKFGINGETRCEYSGELILVENFSVDHRQPVARGGSWALENLALCSEKQNLRKGIMTKGEYAIFAAMVTTHLPHEVQQSIWRKLEIGDVQRFNYFKRQKK